MPRSDSQLMFRALRRLTVLGCAFAARTAQACQGPGAEARIARAELLGWKLWGGTLLLVACWLLVFRRRLGSPLRPRAVLVLAFAHPAWWLGARAGDCGELRILMSFAATTLTLGAMAHATWTLRRGA